MEKPNLIVQVSTSKMNQIIHKLVNNQNLWSKFAYIMTISTCNIIED